MVMQPEERKVRPNQKNNFVIKDNMYVSIVIDLMTGITTSTVTKNMNVAKKMLSNVQNVEGSFLTSKIVSIT